MVIKISELVQKQKIRHSPRLSTIKMVEETLENMEESTITVAKLKKILPKQVNHNTLIEILEYLEDSRKIYIGIRGITWVYNNSPKMKKALAEGTRH